LADSAFGGVAGGASSKLGSDVTGPPAADYCCRQNAPKQRNVADRVVFSAGRTNAREHNS